MSTPTETTTTPQTTTEEAPAKGSVIDNLQKEVNEDPFTKRLLADMGILLNKEGAMEKATPAAREPQAQINQSFVTFGEAVKHHEEDKKAKADAEAAAEVTTEADTSGSGRGVAQSRSEKETETTKGTQTKPNKNAEGATEQAAAAPKRKVSVNPPERPLEEVVEETVRKALHKNGAAANDARVEASAQTKQDKPAEDEFENNLTPQEKRELDLWKFAAVREPDKYKDAPKKWLDFYKKVDAYIAKASEGDTDRTLDDKDEEFVKFVQQNKPAFSAAEREDIRDMMVEDRVTNRVKTQYEKELESRDKKLREIEMRPIVEKTLNHFDSHALALMANTKESTAAEVAAKISEVGFEEARKEYRIETPIVEAEWKRTRELASEYLKLKTGLETINVEKPIHKELVNFIIGQGTIFEAEGGDARFRAGPNGQRQQFLPNHKFNELASTNPAQIGNYWTFSDGDVIDLLAIDANQNAQRLIKAKEKELEDAGYKREKKQKVAKQETPIEAPKATTNPKITTSASPGAATGGPEAPIPGALTASEMKALGLPFSKV